MSTIFLGKSQSLKQVLGGGAIAFLFALLVFSFIHALFDYYLAEKLAIKLISLGWAVDSAYILGETMGTFYSLSLAAVPFVNWLGRRPKEPTRKSEMYIVNIFLIVFFIALTLFIII